MYIERLQVRNVRLLAEQELSFLREDGTPRLWTVIVGENGLCKSTILQAIALTALGPKLATALVQDARRFRYVSTENAAEMTSVFRTPDGSPLISSLAIKPLRYDLVAGPKPEGALRLDDVRAYRTPDWFVAGYGVGRFLPLPGEVALPRDQVVDRMEGLFDWRHKMLGLDFFAALQSKDQALAVSFAETLAEVLLSEDEDGRTLLPGLKGPLNLHQGGSRFEGSRAVVSVWDRGLAMPIDWLSDGYQAMLAWIADLLGHVFLDRGAAVDPAQCEGVVLLDEIDLHLHPTWQRHVVPILKRVFPKLQFIVTTHSPLVLAGFDREEIIVLKLEDGLVVQDPSGLEPGIQTASEILTNFFEVHRAGRPDLVAKERRYLKLKGLKSPQFAEIQELRALEDELTPYWTASGPTEELLSPQETLQEE